MAVVSRVVWAVCFVIWGVFVSELVGKGGCTAVWCSIESATKEGGAFFPSFIWWSVGGIFEFFPAFVSLAG